MIVTTMDVHDLKRFLDAQNGIFEIALSELRNGQKRTHWMWFIFPQVEGLGRSDNSRKYSIKSRKEALAYLSHPILGKRLLECAETLLAINNKSAIEIFSTPDHKKLKSSMTLFASLTETQSVFDQVLEKYFDKKRDKNTLYLLSRFSD